MSVRHAAGRGLAGGRSGPGVRIQAGDGGGRIRGARQAAGRAQDRRIEVCALPPEVGPARKRGKEDRPPGMGAGRPILIPSSAVWAAAGYQDMRLGAGGAPGATVMLRSGVGCATCPTAVTWPLRRFTVYSREGPAAAPAGVSVA